MQITSHSCDVQESDFCLAVEEELHENTEGAKSTMGPVVEKNCCVIFSNMNISADFLMRWLETKTLINQYDIGYSKPFYDLDFEKKTCVFCPLKANNV